MFSGASLRQRLIVVEIEVAMAGTVIATFDYCAGASLRLKRMRLAALVVKYCGVGTDN